MKANLTELNDEQMQIFVDEICNYEYLKSRYMDYKSKYTKLIKEYIKMIKKSWSKEDNKIIQNLVLEIKKNIEEMETTRNVFEKTVKLSEEINSNLNENRMNNLLIEFEADDKEIKDLIDEIKRKEFLLGKFKDVLSETENITSKLDNTLDFINLEKYNK